MDHLNRFATRGIFSALRLEYALLLVVSVYLAILHIDEIRWAVFIGLFVYIDVIGYIPGAVAFRRSSAGQISSIYYVLYNVMHSAATQIVVALLWCVLVKPEWALLSLAIHLCGDRALFGNFLKTIYVPYEPSAIPLFVEFEDNLFKSQHPSVNILAEVQE